MSAVLECDAANLEGARGALSRLHVDSEARLDAIVVHAVYAAGACAHVADRLQRERHRLAPRDYADGSRRQVEVIGEPISPSDRHPSGPEPEQYFASAEPFRALCAAMFSPAPSFVDRRRDILAVLAGVPARQLVAGGRSYGSATFRHVPPGCELTLHCENLYADIPLLAPAARVADLQRTLSCFMPIVTPRAGGALCIYGTDAGAGSEGPSDVTGSATTLFPQVGDLVVFAAGPRYHRVTRVEGDVARWTIGGFMAPSRDDAALWLWG
jgi:hypothetical protein